MISINDAKNIVQTNMPNGTINAAIRWDEKWLFSVFTDDPHEGDLDPFYAVYDDGTFTGFSIVGDEDTAGIIAAFNSALAHAEATDAFLMHYGVKGMRWGVRKDDRTGGSNRGSSAKGPSAASKSAESLLNTIKPAAGMFIPTANVRNKIITVGQLVAQGAKMDVALKTAMYNSPLAIAGYGISALDSGAYRVPVVATQNALRGGWPVDKSLSKKNMSVDEIQKKVIKDINPQFPGLGTTNNCLRATYTYEMRRRGYDVAATKTMLASGQTNMTARFMTKTFKGPTKVKSTTPYTGIKGKILTKPPTSAEVFAALAKQPDRSRGDLQMRWGMLGGHSVAYEIVGGKPVVFDTQSGKTYSSPRELDQLTKGAASSLSFNRLDDKNLNQTALTAWLKDNKS